MAELKRGLMEKEGEAQEMALSKEMAAKQALQEQLREAQEQVRASGSRTLFLAPSSISVLSSVSITP